MKIHPFTLFYLFLAFMSHNSFYVAYLLFSILHEMGHYCIALYYHFEIEDVRILPFGAYLSLKDFGYHLPYEEIIMLVMGPFVNLFLSFLFLYLHQYDLFKINIFIFIFNLLPIYPLDGSKLLLLFLSYFMDYKKCFHIQIKISLLGIVMMFIMNKQLGKFLVLSYLFYQTIHYIKQYRYLYYKTILKDNLKKTKIKLNKKLIYFRPYHNVYQFENKVYDFEQIKIYLLKSR